MPYPKEKVGGKDAILERQQIFVEHLTHDDAGAAFLFPCSTIKTFVFQKQSAKKVYTHNKKVKNGNNVAEE